MFMLGKMSVCKCMAKEGKTTIWQLSSLQHIQNGRKCLTITVRVAISARSLARGSAWPRGHFTTQPLQALAC